MISSVSGKTQAEKMIAGDSLKELNAIVLSIQQKPLLSALRNTLVQRKSNRKIPFQVICTSAPHASERTTEWKIYQACFNLLITFSENVFYSINTYSFNDTIYYASLQRTYQPGFSIIYTDSLRLDKIIRQHYNYYGHQPDSLQILQDLNGFYIYAYGCGEADTPPELRNEAEELIAEKDTATLTTWLCSMNPEKQAYGLEGLGRVGKSGMKINSQTVERMKHVSKLHYKLYSCRGCVTRYPQKFSEVVSPGELRKLKRRS
jgi:hypothetical protein